MRNQTLAFGVPELLIVAGGGVFIFILALLAYFEADIRWLHFFQSWIYLAAMALSLRHNRWGYFIGISAAGFWNYVSLCVTTFFAGTALAECITDSETSPARRSDHRRTSLDWQSPRYRGLHLGVHKAAEMCARPVPPRAPALATYRPRFPAQLLPRSDPDQPWPPVFVIYLPPASRGPASPPRNPAAWLAHAG